MAKEATAQTEKPSLEQKVRMIQWLLNRYGTTQVEAKGEEASA